MIPRLRSTKASNKGITFAAAILVIFIVIFGAVIAYLAQPTDSTANAKTTYFEDLNFKIDPNKIWHVGVPITEEGNLNLSLTSNNPVRVYARYGNGGTYLLDKVVSGHQQFVMHVDPTMRTIEVAVVNQQNATVAVSGLTCFWTR